MNICFEADRGTARICDHDDEISDDLSKVHSAYLDVRKDLQNCLENNQLYITGGGGGVLKFFFKISLVFRSTRLIS